MIPVVRDCTPKRATAVINSQRPTVVGLALTVADRVELVDIEARRVGLGMPQSHQAAA
jgi:hypothetical protein